MQRRSTARRSRAQHRHCGAKISVADQRQGIDRHCLAKAMPCKAEQSTATPGKCGATLGKAREVRISARQGSTSHGNSTAMRRSAQQMRCIAQQCAAMQRKGSALIGRALQCKEIKWERRRTTCRDTGNAGTAGRAWTRRNHATAKKKGPHRCNGRDPWANMTSTERFYQDGARMSRKKTRWRKTPDK